MASNIIERRVLIRELATTNSFKLRNENMADKNGNYHMIGENRKGRITGRITKTGQQLQAFNYGLDNDIFMEMVLNKSKTDINFPILCNEFWKDVLIEVDPNLGLELNVTFNINLGKEVILPSGNKITITEETFLSYTKDKPELEYLFGIPTNIQDYWKWRFCLNSSQVANTREIAEKHRGAKNIAFYIHNEVEEVKTKTASVALKREALSTMLKYLSDDKMIESVLRIFENGGSYNNHSHIKFSKLFAYDDLIQVDKVDTFMKIAEELPTSFINIINEPDLVHKTMARKAITKGVIVNENGTTVYTFGEEVIAESFVILVNKLKTDNRLYTSIVNRLSNTKKPEKVNDSDKLRDVTENVKEVKKI